MRHKTVSTDMWKRAGIKDDQPRIFPDEGCNRPGVRGMYFENEPYQGKATQVYAWIGLPYLEPGQTCPGMVLLHGGGGTAFDEWVRLWNRRGYAAITFDQCGCVPLSEPNAEGALQERHAKGGPPGWDSSFYQVSGPIEDQWQYHAVAAAVRAHSILASLPEVDASRIGVTGVSWGGYLTCLVAAADQRLRCAIPVYGCGYLGDNSVWNDTVFPELENGVVDSWLEQWDPSHFLPYADLPFCWLNGTNDIAYPLDSLEKSCKLTRGTRTKCIRIEMPHSHPDGWDPIEIGTFADSLLIGGAPLQRIVRAEMDGDSLAVDFEAARPIMKAELICTRATGHWTDRKYRALPANLDSEKARATAQIPRDATVYFMNLYDDRGCVVSSELFPGV